MNLIPVIDLMRGQVVHACRGDRSRYRPIESQLCAGSDPIPVAQALCEYAEAHTLYVADLDALMGGAPQQATLRALHAALPHTTLWLDAGFADAAAAAALLAALDLPAGRVVPVLASEALRSPQAYAQSFNPAPRDDLLLSLDRRDGVPLDAAGCWTQPAHWPTRVIAMTLEQVGSRAGPDVQTLAALRALYPTAQLYGAGGVRNASDLARAREAGASGWLVATALHERRLGAWHG